MTDSAKIYPEGSESKQVCLWSSKQCSIILPISLKAFWDYLTVELGHLVFTTIFFLSSISQESRFAPDSDALFKDPSAIGFLITTYFPLIPFAIVNIKKLCLCTHFWPSIQKGNAIFQVFPMIPESWLRLTNIFWMKVNATFVSELVNPGPESR